MIHTTSFSDYYVPMLLNLSDDTKLDIIAKLKATMRPHNKMRRPKPDIRKCFSGDWENDKSTNEVADELRISRYYEPKDLEW